MSVQKFEDKRWSEHPQKKEFRHSAAAQLIKSGSVLDIGCGDGLLLRMLKEKGIAGSGVDISPEAVEKCRALGFDATEHPIDEALPFSAGSFDTTVLLDVLEHVYDPNFVLAEAARVATQAVIIGVPNFSSLPARLQVLFGKVPENNRPNKGHLQWFNWIVLKKMANKNRLSIVKLEVNAPWESVPLLGLFTKGAARVWPNLFALSFVIRYKKY